MFCLNYKSSLESPAENLDRFELFKKSGEQKRWMGAQCKVTDRVGSWYWAVERCCLDGRLGLAKYLEKKCPTAAVSPSVHKYGA